MPIVYRSNRIPHWVWIVLGISGIILLYAIISTAASQRRDRIIVANRQVQTGNPADYVQGRTPAPSTVPAPGVPVPVPSPTPSPSPVPGGTGTVPPPAPTPSTPSPTEGVSVPTGLPQVFRYQRVIWIPTSGPVTVEVITTGQSVDDHIIYHRQGDQPPYEALYVETAPNSGQFYRYTPESQASG